MCAINGIFLRNNRISSQEARRLCEAMADTMAHRGPDDRGFFVDSTASVYLGHRRLSIIDLSTAGRQPLYNEDRSIAVLVNGEIYNYQKLRSELTSRGHHFSSTCDIEVIAHLFEEKKNALWTDLRGMYAAAIYQEGNLYLARDPLGIKPLYMLEHPDLIAFASELRAFEVLRPFAGDLDIDGVTDFLLLGSIPAPRSLRRGIRALQPGEVIHINCNGIKAQGRSPIPGWCQEAAEGSPVSIHTLKETLRESVSKHLMSDVPIGVFLSGGIDSGMIAGVASEVSQSSVHTVSVVIPGHELNESIYARQTAELYGTHHSEIELDQTSFEKDLPHFFKHLDLPSIDGLNTFIVSKAAKKAGLKVALTGLGGDELFAGYPSFDWIKKFTFLHKGANLLGGLGRQSVAFTLQMLRSNSGTARVSELFKSPLNDLRIGYLACRGLFVGRFFEELLLPELKDHAYRAQERFLDETAWVNEMKIPSQLAVGGLELTRYMTSQLLRDTDVMSMAHSLEVRTPLVDKEVVRYSLPFLVHPSVGDGFPKWPLRQALSKPLPRSVVQRPKQGFVFPWQEWLRGIILEDFNRRLAEPGSWKEVLRPESVKWWRDAYLRGWAHWSTFWALYVLMRFLDKS